MILCSDKNPCIIYDDANDKTHTRIHIYITCGKKKLVSKNDSERKTREYANFMIKLMASGWTGVREEKATKWISAWNWPIRFTSTLFGLYRFPCIFVCPIKCSVRQRPIRVPDWEARPHTRRKRTERSTNQPNEQIWLDELICVKFSADLVLTGIPVNITLYSIRDDHSYHTLHCFEWSLESLEVEIPHRHHCYQPTTTIPAPAIEENNKKERMKTDRNKVSFLTWFDWRVEHFAWHVCDLRVWQCVCVFTTLHRSIWYDVCSTIACGPLTSLSHTMTTFVSLQFFHFRQFVLPPAISHMFSMCEYPIFIFNEARFA